MHIGRMHYFFDRNEVPKVSINENTAHWKFDLTINEVSFFFHEQHRQQLIKKLSEIVSQLTEGEPTDV